MFRVPSPDEMLEDSVTCWLESEEEDESRSAGESLPSSASAAREPTDEPRAASPAPVAAGAQARVKPAKRWAARRLPGAVAEVGEAVEREAVEPRREATTPVASAQAAVAQGGSDQPRVQVMDIGAAGVRIGFSGRWLGRAAFRASMPLCCMLCEESDAAQLIARPIAWVDRAHMRMHSSGELEQRYEVHVRAHQTGREVTEAMRAMDEFVPPFNNPMPWFVCRRCASRATVHAEIYGTPDGVECEVVIPAGRYAMTWVGRVNGVCGDDFAELEAKVLRLENQAWRSIPEPVRDRLAAWFDFEPDEQFLAYFSDSDFAKKDAGLAGVVLTDRRVVYCKYHQHGSIRLDDAFGNLELLPDGLFCELSYQNGETRRKVSRLRGEDAGQLASMINLLRVPMRVTPL